MRLCATKPKRVSRMRYLIDMSDKFLYQNARIKAMENKLLSSQHIQRLFECENSDEAFKLLADAGFGAGKSVAAGDFDALFAAEEEAACDILREFNADGALDAILIRNDYHNLKALIKIRLAEKDECALAPRGICDTEDLRAAVFGGKSVVLPHGLTAALAKAEKMISDGKATPRRIGAAIDREGGKDAARLAKAGGEAVREYCAKRADFANISVFVRAKRLGLSVKDFEESFFFGGEIELSEFLSIFDSGLDALKEKTKYTPYAETVAKLCDGGGFAEFEKNRDDVLIEIFRSRSDDMFSAAPVLNYYFTRIQAIKAAKLVVAGIKNNVDRALIKERMRDIYA